MGADDRVLIVDTDEREARAIAHLVEQSGFAGVSVAASVWQAMERLEEAPPGALVVSYDSRNADPLLFCRALKQGRPRLPAIVLAASAAARREVEVMGLLTAGVDVLLEKPLDETRLLAALREATSGPRARASSRPGAVVGVPTGREPGIELTARTILFTDVRGSTQWLEAATAQMFFRELNRKLSQQCDAVRRFRGEVMKFTGDGLMAVFQGLDRLAGALRCALAIQELEKGHGNPDMPMIIGQGLCDGIVVCGAVGKGGDTHRDIFGRSVHLAARLCGQAPAGAILLAKKDFERSGLQNVSHTEMGFLTIRGLKAPVDCVQIGPAVSLEPPPR